MPRKYELKELFALWCEWAKECDIHLGDFYDYHNMDGGFINWLERREKEKTAKQKILNVRDKILKAQEEEHEDVHALLEEILEVIK
jgi:hypothetical protein